MPLSKELCSSLFVSYLTINFSSFILFINNPCNLIVINHYVDFFYSFLAQVTSSATSWILTLVGLSLGKRSFLLSSTVLTSPTLTYLYQLLIRSDMDSWWKNCWLLTDLWCLLGPLELERCVANLLILTLWLVCFFLFFAGSPSYFTYVVNETFLPIIDSVNQCIHSESQLLFKRLTFTLY